VYGPLNWWSIEDLRAEIRQVPSIQFTNNANENRESTSNNRVKSGYEDRHKTPLDKVPDAGSVSVCSPPTCLNILTSRVQQTLSIQKNIKTHQDL